MAVSRNGAALYRSEGRSLFTGSGGVYVAVGVGQIDI